MSVAFGASLLCSVYHERSDFASHLQNLFRGVLPFLFRFPFADLSASLELPVQLHYYILTDCKRRIIP